MPVSYIRNKIRSVLWDIELEQLPNWQRAIIKLLRIFQAVIHDMSDEGLAPAMAS